MLLLPCPIIVPFKGQYILLPLPFLPFLDFCLFNQKLFQGKEERGGKNDLIPFPDLEQVMSWVHYFQKFIWGEEGE